MIPKNPAVVRKFLFLFFLYVAILPGFETRRIKRIIGGENVEDNEILYQASVRVDGIHRCAGTIISSKHILTAAHCFVGLHFEPPFDELTIVTGTKYNKYSSKSHPVFNISWDEGFVNGRNDSWYNDIAVVTLDDEIEFDKTQAPAFLPLSPVSTGVKGIISGWGREETENPYHSKVLKKATVEILDREECQKHMKSTIREGQICGFANKHVGVCQGDSGGPLVVDGTIVGIISWNIPCATGVPDVFTDVYQYLGFIDKVMESNKKRIRPPGAK